MRFSVQGDYVFDRVLLCQKKKRYRRRMIFYQGNGQSRTPVPTGLIVVLKFVCRGGYYPPVYDNPSVIFLRKCHLPLHKGGVFLVLALLFGVIFLDCRGRRPRRPVYKNIIAICTGRRRRRPLPICARFNLSVVGAIHESPADDQWSPLRI